MDEWTSFCGTSATIKFYTGTQPAGNGATTTRLVTLTFDVTAWAGIASTGTLVLNGIVGGSAAATGSATWFRVETSGSVWCFDGDISTIAIGSGDVQLDSTAIVENGQVSLAGPNVITAPDAA